MAYHADNLPNICPQAHPVKEAHQGGKCALETGGVRRGDHAVVGVIIYCVSNVIEILIFLVILLVGSLIILKYHKSGYNIILIIKNQIFIQEFLISLEGQFEVPPGHERVDASINHYLMVPSFLFYSIAILLVYFVDCHLDFYLLWKITAGHFKYEILPSLNAKYSIEFDISVAMHFLREKRKPRWKISYEIFKETYDYDPLIDIYLFPTLIQLTGVIGGIQNCIKIVSKWIFDRNIPFELPLNFEELDNCCTDQYKWNEIYFS